MPLPVRRVICKPKAGTDRFFPSLWYLAKRGREPAWFWSPDGIANQEFGPFATQALAILDIIKGARRVELSYIERFFEVLKKEDNGDEKTDLETGVSDL